MVAKLNLKATSFNIPKIIYTFNREYSEENIQKFRNYLKSLLWNSVYSEKNLNVAFAEFYTTFHLLYVLCFPKIKKKIVLSSKARWLSKGIRKSCETKRKLRYNYYNNKTYSNKRKYNNYSKLFKKCLFNAKRNANSKYIINNKHNIGRATWNIIDNEINNNCINREINEIVISFISLFLCVLLICL